LKSEQRKERKAEQKNIRIPAEMAERISQYVELSGYTITQTYLQALDEYLKERGY
jgi:predicted DNA-binding protein